MTILKRLDFSFVVVFVQVLMAVHQLFVPVRMFVHQIGLNQEIWVEQEILWLPVRHDVVLCPHHDDAGRNLLDNIQVLRAEDEAFICFRPLQQEINQMPLTGWVQAGCRFVQ